MRGEPFQFTMEPLTKLEPATVIVKAGSPLKAEFGVIEIRLGGGLLTVNRTPVDKPPPGAGVKTVIIKVPAFVRSEGNSTNDNCVPETKVVTRSAPLTRTTEFGLNPVPSIVKVFCPEPAVTEV